MRRDTERVRARSAANISTPTPVKSEMPTFDGNLNPFPYCIIYAPINRIDSVRMFSRAGKSSASRLVHQGKEEGGGL